VRAVLCGIAASTRMVNLLLKSIAEIAVLLEHSNYEHIVKLLVFQGVPVIGPANLSGVLRLQYKRKNEEEYKEPVHLFL
jgi:hypothetical protein